MSDARLAEHQDRHEHGRLAARQDHHLVGRDVDLIALVQVGGDGLAQRRNAGRRRVAVVAVAQRLDRGLDDELGRAEIGLADAEIDHVAALRDQRIGARQHGERVLLADAIEVGYGSEHGITPWRRLRCLRCHARPWAGHPCLASSFSGNKLDVDGRTKSGHDTTEVDRAYSNGTQPPARPLEYRLTPCAP